MRTDEYALVAAHAPDAPVAFGPEGDRVAADLGADACWLARHLPEPQPGSHVALVCNDRYLFAVALCAAWQKGHAVALPPNARTETVLEVFARPEVLALCHDTDRPEGLDLRALLAERPSGVALGAGGAAGPGFRLPGERLLATVFTSGSTGVSQACPKRALQLLGEARALLPHFGPHLAGGAGFRVLATVPPHHIYGLLFSVLCPLLGGGAFFRGGPLHAETIAALAAEHGATVLVSVPAHLRALELLAGGRLAGIRTVFSSAAPLPAETASMMLERHGLPVTEILGSSETGGIAWRQQTRGPHWRPLDGVTVSAAAEGVLCVDAPWLDPDAPRPHWTADRVRFEGEGFVHLGRADGVVKIGGKRIATADLERRLGALRGVVDAAVVAVPGHGARDHELLAAVVAPGWTAQDLRQALSEWFDPSVLPRRLRVVEALPREDNGKLTRARFLALFGRDGAPAEVTTGERRVEAGALGEVHRLDVQVPANLEVFEGHFPGAPVFPAALQLTEIVLPRVRAIAPALGPVRQVTRLRFPGPLGPGDDLELVLVLHPEGGRVDFELRKAGAVASSGRIGFAAGG